MLGNDSKTKVKRSLLIFLLFSLLILPTQIMLTDTTTPSGIADLELAGSLQQAQAILEHWGEEKHWVVLASLILDFPFLIAYTLFFFYLTRYLTEKLHPKNDNSWRMGKAIGAGFILAGLCDIFENIALFPIVLNTTENTWALIAYYCATIKFTALGVGAMYLIMAAVVVGLTKKRADAK